MYRGGYHLHTTRNIRRSLFSIPSLACIVCRHFDGGHSHRLEVIPRYDLNLHVSNNWWFCASFHVLFFFFFYKIVSVVSAFSYCLDDTLPFVKISFRILTENFWAQVSCSPAALLNIKSPKQQFSSCFCGNSTGKQHVFKANPAYSCTQRFSKSCVLGLHIGLGCARSNTPELECCHSIFF